MTKRTAPECIASLYGMCITDVSEMRYQPGEYPNPGIYLVNDNYHCAPTVRQRLPKGFLWSEIGEAYGRKIFKAEPPTER